MRTTARRAVQIVCVLTTASLLAACGAGKERPSEDGSAVGVTDTSIKVGAHFPLTGPAAPGYSEIPSGHQAFYEYVNDNGGVHGRDIEMVVKDDAYNPTNTSAVTNDMILQDEIFAMVGGLGTPTHRAVVQRLNDDGIPDLFVSSGSLQWGDNPSGSPMTFGWQPDYEIEGKVIGQYIKENMPDAKVGLFLQDDDFGEDGEKGARQFLDAQIVDVQKYTPGGSTDFSPQMSSFKSKGVDLVIGFNTPSYTALSQIAAQGVGFKSKWFYSNVGSDPALVGGLLASMTKGKIPAEQGVKLMDGMMTTEYIPGVDAPDDEWVKLWQKVWDEYSKKGSEKLTNYRIYGMSQAYTFVQALQANGKDLTRESIVETIEKEGSSFEGPGMAPFRFSEDSHMGISGMSVVEIKNGASEPLTPVLVTDIGDAPIEEDDSAASDAPPSSGLPE